MIIIEKIIGNHSYFLSDESKETGDWVVSKHQIDEQIGNTNEYMNHVFNKPFEIGIGQCRLETYFTPPLLIADNISLAGNALQSGTYKIIRTNNPQIPISWDDLLEQEEYLFDIS